MRTALALLVCLAACDRRALEISGETPSDLGTTPDLAGRVCGSRGSAPCPTGFYCELGSLCGADDSGGTCLPRPESCSKNAQPECGCDGATYANACLRARAQVSLAHAGACSNPCEAEGGYCDPGDFVKPTCKAGYQEAPQLDGACGLGICCVPAPPPPPTGDCRATGCATGSRCDGCLGSNGVEYVGIPDNAAC